MVQATESGKQQQSAMVQAAASGEQQQSPMEQVAAADGMHQQSTMEQVMLDLLKEMNTVVTSVEATIEDAVVRFGDEKQSILDASMNPNGFENQNVKQPLEDAIASVKLKKSWDTKRKNMQTARKRQMKSARRSEEI